MDFYTLCGILGTEITRKFLEDDIRLALGSPEKKLSLFEKYRYTFNFRKEAREYLIGDNCDIARDLIDASSIYWRVVNGAGNRGSVWVSDNLDKKWSSGVIDELSGLHPKYIDLSHEGGRHFVQLPDQKKGIENFIRAIYWIQKGSEQRHINVFEFENYDQSTENPEEMTPYSDKLSTLVMNTNAVIITHSYERKDHLSKLIGNSTPIKLKIDIITERKKKVNHNYDVVIIDGMYFIDYVILFTGAHYFSYVDFAVIIAGLIRKLKYFYVLGLSNTGSEAFKDICRMARYFQGRFQVGDKADWSLVSIKGESTFGIPSFKLAAYVSNETISELIKKGHVTDAVILCTKTKSLYWKSLIITSELPIKVAKILYLIDV